MKGWTYRLHILMGAGILSLGQTRSSHSHYGKWVRVQAFTVLADENAYKAVVDP